MKIFTLTFCIWKKIYFVGKRRFFCVTGYLKLSNETPKPIKFPLAW